MRPTILLLRAAVLTALLTGCYDLKPVTVTPAGFAAAVPVGRQVEAVLSEQGTAALTARVGPGAGTLLGTVTRFTSDTVEIALTEVRTRTGVAYFLQGAVIPVSRNELAQLRVREELPQHLGSRHLAPRQHRGRTLSPLRQHRANQ